MSPSKRPIALLNVVPLYQERGDNMKKTLNNSKKPQSEMLKKILAERQIKQ